MLCAIDELALAELYLKEIPVAESTTRALKHGSSQSALAPDGRGAFYFTPLSNNDIEHTTYPKLPPPRRRRHTDPHPLIYADQPPKSAGYPAGKR